MIQQQNKPDNKRAILALLKDGEVLTVTKTLRLIGTIELRHYIAEFRKEMTIKDKWVTSASGKRFKQYWMERAAQ